MGMPELALDDQERDAHVALLAFAVADDHSPTPRVQVGLGERQRFADPQPGAPEHDDQRAQTYAIMPAQLASALFSCSHHLRRTACLRGRPGNCVGGCWSD